MSFSAKRCAYCPRPSFSSQSVTCCIAAAPPDYWGLNPPVWASLSLMATALESRRSDGLRRQGTRGSAPCRRTHGRARERAVLGVRQSPGHAAMAGDGVIPRHLRKRGGPATPHPHRRGRLCATSALPLKADVCHCVRHVAEVPGATFGTAANSVKIPPRRRDSSGPQRMESFNHICGRVSLAGEVALTRQDWFSKTERLH